MSDVWNEICESRTDLRDLPTVVAGNKCDLSTKKVKILVFLLVFLVTF